MTVKGEQARDGAVAAAMAATGGASSEAQRAGGRVQPSSGPGRAERAGRARVVVAAVKPEVDCGRYAVKRTAGDRITVEADVFADGHDLVSCAVLWRRAGDGEEEGGARSDGNQGVSRGGVVTKPWNGWNEVPMEPLGNDRWRGRFVVDDIGRYEYTIVGWIDRFGTWRRDLVKRVEAGQDVGVDLVIGGEIVREAAELAARADNGGTGAERPGGGGGKRDSEQLAAAAAVLESGRAQAERVESALDERLQTLMNRWGSRRDATELGRRLSIRVDPEKARFSAWYELFPRSCGTDGKHGTLRDVIARLEYIAEMGFDVLYLPPIHPIGRQFRKGKNNAVKAEPGDVGSPWAIGAAEGGHTAVHPDLGTLEDFDALVAAARKRRIDIALDIAYQCAPDHPYVKEHPGWFRQRPDGTIQYAENPPKKYQDIYPFEFECEDWRGLWEELRDIVLFWCGHGVRIFRVDNPHTKALPFWEWMIGQVKEEYPETIFLSEAFTRPKVMYQLAKLGFTQSYTYFTWRNSKWELEQYLTELTRTEVCEYFRPNLWPNTPDILHEYLQHGGPAAFMARLVLAATLSSSYGIYGPPFELCIGAAREPGSEEYLDSEKYQIRAWPWPKSVEEAPAASIAPLIARVNRIRRENRALQRNDTLRFHRVHNDDLICYSKRTPDYGNVILCVVNLNPYESRWGQTELDLAELGLEGIGERSYQVHDLLSEARYTWHGARNMVGLDPGSAPAHIFRIRRRARTEQQFEYFL